MTSTTFRSDQPRGRHQLAASAMADSAVHVTPSRRGDDDPLWYKDAIIYQLHVKAFFDSNGDGIGDFRGLTAEARLHPATSASTRSGCCRSIPSPLRDDGYDIADYHDVHPRLRHARGLPPLLRGSAPARAARHHRAGHQPHLRSASVVPGRAARAHGLAEARLLRLERRPDTKYAGTRIIFTDTETSNWAWDPVAKQYYWHRFFSHQPDLNFDNPHVAAGGDRRRCASGSTWASTACGWTRSRTCSSARARATRTCRRRTPC